MTFKIKCLSLFTLLLFSTAVVFSQNTTAAESSTSIDSVAARTFHERGMQNISSQDFDEAEVNLIKAVNANPKLVDARLALIRIYYLQKQFPEAEKQALEGISLQPNTEVLWQALTDIYKETKKYNELVNVFDKLIAIDDSKTKNFLDKAYTYSLLKDYKSALRVYNDTEKRFGASDQIYSGRSAIYVQQKKKKKAIKELQDYLKDRQDQASAYLMLAHLYLDLNEPKNALKELNKAEKRFPNNYDILLSKADTYQQLKNENELLIQLKKAFAYKELPLERKINILFTILRDFEPQPALVISDALSVVLIQTHPNDANAFAIYGDVLLQQGKTKEALAQFRKALELNPKLDVVWENVLQIELADNNYEQVKIDGEIALKHYPNSSVLALFTGYAYLLNKEHKEARPFIEHALDHADPKNEGLMLQTYSALGDLYNALELYDVSNIAYDEALKIDSNNTYVLNNYAYYLTLRKEELDKAVDFSKRSNELEPNNSSFQDTYAWVLFQKGNYDEALSWIQKALDSSLNPSSTLLEHKGDILSKLGNEKEALSYWAKAKVVALQNNEKTDKLEQKIKSKIYVD